MIIRVILVVVLLSLIVGIYFQLRGEVVECPDYVPEPYYISTSQQYGEDILQGYLQGWYWSTPYEADVFDCTEMSALLERWLENKGFHTYIAGGQLNNDPHCWLRVEVAPSKYVIVEATTSRVITDAEYNKYHETDQFETIYDAVKINLSAFDWWN